MILHRRLEEKSRFNQFSTACKSKVELCVSDDRPKFPFLPHIREGDFV